MEEEKHIEPANADNDASCNSVQKSNRVSKMGPKGIGDMIAKSFDSDFSAEIDLNGVTIQSKNEVQFIDFRVEESKGELMIPSPGYSIKGVRPINSETPALKEHFSSHKVCNEGASFNRQIVEDVRKSLKPIKFLSVQQLE